MFTTNLLQGENEVGAWQVIPRPEAMKAYMEARRRGKRQKPDSQKIALLQTAIQGWTCRLPYLPIVPATYNFISQHPAANNFLIQAWESMSSNHSVPLWILLFCVIWKWLGERKRLYFHIHTSPASITSADALHILAAKTLDMITCRIQNIHGYWILCFPLVPANFDATFNNLAIPSPQKPKKYQGHYLPR